MPLKHSFDRRKARLKLRHQTMAICEKNVGNGNGSHESVSRKASWEVKFSTMRQDSSGGTMVRFLS